MRDPHVRFCERRGGVISRAYSTGQTRGSVARVRARCAIIASPRHICLERFVRSVARVPQ
jgi:hypothetical protein